MSRKTKVTAEPSAVIEGLGKPAEEADEDWCVAPCRCCKSQVMIWWRYCSYCGTKLPTVLDGKVVQE
jgi:hypothetical protein